MGIWQLSVKEFFVAGGPIMIPLAICSIVAIGIVLGKLVYFKRIQTNVLELKERVFELLKKDKREEAATICEEDPSPVAKIMKAGILKYGRSRDEIKEAMEDVSLFEIPLLEKRFNALVTIAHISPLLGLLGTVTGMTTCFYTIEARAVTMNPVTPGDLAGGIGEALITTVAGLFVAIPTYVAYNYMVSRVNAFIHEMEHAATEILKLLCHLAETSGS